VFREAAESDEGKQERELNMDAKHTPEPWHVATNPGGPDDQPAFPSVRDNSGLKHGQDIVCMPLGDSDTVKANAERIVACVNGCEGLNPAAYREVLAALEDLLSSYGYAYSGKDYQAALAAFAKAKGI